MRRMVLSTMLAMILGLGLTACGNDTGTKSLADNSEQEKTENASVDKSSRDGGNFTPEISVDPQADTLTENGVYLYDGTVLAFGETAYLNDAEAVLDLTSVDLNGYIWKSHDLSRIEVTFDGSNLPEITDEAGTVDSTTGYRVYYTVDGWSGVYVNTVSDPDDPYNGDAATPAIVSIQLWDDTEYEPGIRMLQWDINGQPADGNGQNPIGNLVNMFGVPAAAYCSSLEGIEPLRADTLYYLWKTDNMFILYGRTYGLKSEWDDSTLYFIPKDQLEAASEVLPSLKEAVEATVKS